MGPINFINKNSSVQHKAVRLWFRISALLITVSIMGMASLQLLLWIEYRAAHAEHLLIAPQKKALEQLAQKIAQQKQTNNLLATHLHHREQIKMHAQLLQSIKASLASGQQLLTASISNSQIELKITGATPQAIVKITEQLTQKKMADNLAIISFEKADNALAALIKGTLIS